MWLLFFSDFLQYHYTVLLSSFLLPFSCTSCCSSSLPCISQILRVESLLSRFSPFVAQMKNFCSEPVFFVFVFLFFGRCLPRISLAVLVTAVLKVVIIESMSVSLLLMMVRGANLPPIIAWKVSNTLGSFSFSR